MLQQSHVPEPGDRDAEVGPVSREAGLEAFLQLGHRGVRRRNTGSLGAQWLPSPGPPPGPRYRREEEELLGRDELHNVVDDVFARHGRATIQRRGPCALAATLRAELGTLCSASKQRANGKENRAEQCEGKQGAPP